MTSIPFLHVPSAEEISRNTQSRMKVSLPQLRLDSSDPAVYWSDSTGEDINSLVEQANESLRSSFILYATGETLRERVREVGVMPDQETDAELLELYLEAFVALSKDTPEYAFQLARRSNRKIADVNLDLDVDGNTITMYVADASAMDLTAAEKNALRILMNRRGNKPIWLDYVIGSITRTPYSISAQVLHERGEFSPEDQVRVNLRETALRLRRLGETVTRSALSQGMWADRVVDITFTEPSGSLVPANNGVVYIPDIEGATLTFVEES